ncbi:MAG TPA: uroporphyrinogen decarboxylase [Cyclobacteriaceae bacterium]|nr:uroporphyrinogen decarboxylase [Cyclobacteriaceae bacterium]
MNLKNDLLLRTLRKEKTERIPVWFMRQAGRYLPDYIKLREKHSFFERVRNPQLAAEITVMPVKQVGVDAAILFSDILVIAQALGVEVEIIEGKGPLIADPVRTKDQVDNLTPAHTQDILSYAIPTTKAVKEALEEAVPLIGFCGSPWTLLCYMVEGKGSKDFAKAKQFCYQHPELAAILLDKITEASIIYLKMQLDAGVDTIQIFDSWGGLLSPSDYRKFSLPYLDKIVKAIQPTVPVILYAKGAWFALPELEKTGASCLGLDWNIEPLIGRKMAGNAVVQGNLDPITLLGPAKNVEHETIAMLKNFGKGNYIANLGHGVLPQTPFENAKVFVDTVKNYND